MWKDAETAFAKLDMCHEEDHVLHVKMFFMSFKMRLIAMDMKSEAEDIVDEYFDIYLKMRESCKDSLYCKTIELMMNECFNCLFLRSNRRHEEAYHLISEAVQTARQFPQYQQENKLFKYLLARFYMFYMEEASTRNDVGKVAEFALLGATLNKQVFDRGQPIPSTARCYFYLGCSIMASKETLNRRDRKKVAKYFEQAHHIWRRRIERNGGKVHKSVFWFSFVLLEAFQSYFKYLTSTTSKESCLMKLSAMFENHFHRVLSSPELDNMDLLQVNLKALCSEGHFDKALQYCVELQKHRNVDKMPFAFGVIIKAVQQICVAKTASVDDVSLQLIVDPYLKKMFSCLVDLQKCPNAKSAFWYRLGTSVYYETLQQRNVLEKFSTFEKFRKTSGRWLELPEDRKFEATFGSHKSSLTSLSDVVEIRMSHELKVAFVMQTDQKTSNSQQCASWVRKSASTLHNLFTGNKFNIPPENVVQFESDNLEIVCSDLLLKFLGPFNLVFVVRTDGDSIFASIHGSIHIYL